MKEVKPSSDLVVFMYSWQEQELTARQHNFLTSLLSSIESWLPDFTDQHSWIYTTGRVEGFFRPLKAQLDHMIQIFVNIAASIRFLAEGFVRRPKLTKAHIHCGVAIS
jgi:hypothetical protein